MKPSFLVSLLACTTLACATPVTTPKKLLVYYGWPSVINGCSSSNLACAEAVFSQYDVVVLGDGLEFTSHGDHNNTQTIINDLPNTQFYGYVSLANPNGGTGLDSIKTDIEAWKAMGIFGIFLDEFGYDYTVDGSANYVTRDRQNAAVNCVHGNKISDSYDCSADKKLPVIANAWHPEDALDKLPGSNNNNPSAIPTALGSDSVKDFYFYESYQYSDSPAGYVSISDWQTKATKLHNYLANFPNVGVMAITRAPSSDNAQNIASWAWYSAMLDQFDAVGWSDPFFSAPDSKVTLINWPSISNPGDLTTTAGASPNPRVYTMNTSTGALVLDTAAHNGSFYLSQHAMRNIPAAAQMKFSKYPTAGATCKNNLQAPTAKYIAVTEPGYSTAPNWALVGRPPCVNPAINFSTFAVGGAANYSDSSSRVIQYALTNCTTLTTLNVLLCPL